jgi:hypothetical protein
MSVAKCSVLAPGGTGPLGGVSFGTTTTGFTSATVQAEIWNQKGDPTADTAREVQLTALVKTSADASYELTSPPIANGYLECRVTGIAAGGTGAPTLQVTGWQKIRPGRPCLLDPIPGDSGRTVEFRQVVPAGQNTDAWTWNFSLRWAEPTSPIPAGLWASGNRGVFSRTGDGAASFLISGGAVTPSGTPDNKTTVADTLYRYLGLPKVLLEQQITYDQHDGAAVLLTAGQGYWATLSAGAGPGLTVTKGLAATAPVPITGRVPQPAGEAFVAFVQVTSAAAIGSGDIDQTLTTWGGWLLYGQTGLAAKLGPGSGIAGDSIDLTESAVSLTFPDAMADVRVWKIQANPDLVIQPPPAPDPQALELWRCTTAGGAITVSKDVRRFIGPDRQRHVFRFGATLVVAQELYLTLPGPGDRAICLPYPVLASCDPVTSGSGSNLFELEFWNGSAWVSLFTSSGTQDRRPALAGAGPFVSEAALPEVLVLAGWTQLRARVTAISIPAPTGAVIELLTEAA